MSDAPNKGVPFPEVDRQTGELAALRRMLEASRGTFSLSVAVCNSPALRDHLIAQLQREYEGVFVVEVPEQTEDVYAVVCERTKGNAPSALLVTNLEKSLPSSDGKPAGSPVLRRLNGTRELWKQQHPYPVVFWAPEYVAGMLSTGARDLWAWRSHQFEFVAEPLASAGAAMPAFAGGLTLAGNLDEERKRFRIAELEQRIAEAGDPPAPELARHVSDWLNELGFHFYMLGNLDGAETMLGKALEIAEKLGHLEHMGSACGNLGLIYRKRGDLDQAETMHRKSLEIEEKLGRLEGMASQYGNLGVIYMTRGDLDQAETMYKKSLEISEKLGHLELTANQYGNLGNIYFTRGDLDQAETMLRKALAIDEKLGRLEGMASDYGNLGLIYRTRGDLDQAETMLRKSLAIEEKLGRLEGMARQYGNLGLIYQDRGQLDQAETMYKKSLEISEKVGPLELTANQCGNLGNIYFTRGDLDQAETMLRKSLAINEKLGCLEGMARQSANLGSVYEQRGDVRAAREYWTRARDLFAKIGMPPMTAKTQGWLDGLPIESVPRPPALDIAQPCPGSGSGPSDPRP